MTLTRRLLIGATPLLPSIARAQSFPSRQVRVVVPFPPGGGLDALGRALAEELARAWGQPVVIDNRPGGATVPGTDLVAKAPPDGHTLLLTADNSITGNPNLIRALPHDPVRDLAPVTWLLDVHQMVLAHPSVPARDMAGLVEAARAAPGRLNFGSYGTASQPHLLFGALAARAGITLTHVPYRGLTPALVATLANEVQMTLAGVASARQHIEAGSIRALAVGRPTRLPQLPEVPTLAEQGLDEIDPRTWFGVLAPAATPPGLVARIRDDIAAAMAMPAVRDRHLTPNGYTVQVSTPAAFSAMIARDLVVKRELIARAGITPD
jgi:tripartite-type tricarboxylate transporter receptor subunit TctC